MFNIMLWFKAARLKLLVTSLIPVLLGAMIARYEGFFDGWIFSITILGILMAHTATHFIDDYFDYRSGNWGYKTQKLDGSPLFQGRLTTRQVFWAGSICFCIAFSIGLYLFFTIGRPILYLTLSGAFIVLFYTAPPIRLNYRGFGETAIFLVFGPLLVFGSYYTLARHFSWIPIFVALPLGLAIMNIGIISSIFDYNADLKHNKRSLPLRFGRPKALKIVQSVYIAIYLLMITGISYNFLPLLSFIGLLTIPLHRQIIENTRNYNNLKIYRPTLDKAILLALVLGVILILSYVFEF